MGIQLISSDLISVERTTMGCLSEMMKYVVFLCNFLFFLTGCIVTAFGSYMHFKMKTYFDFVDNPYVNSSIVLIVIGILIALIAFFGCCGACTESSCLMFTFSILMTIILIAEITMVVVALVYKEDAKDFVANSLKEALNNYDPENKKYSGVVTTWDLLQHDFTCCGVQSYTDWTNTPFGKSGNVPDSCCKVEYKHCGVGIKEAINQKGCVNKLVTLIKDNSTAAVGITVAVILIQLLTVIVSCSLARKMSSSNYTV